jgi:hypothetical protein
LFKNGPAIWPCALVCGWARTARPCAVVGIAPMCAEVHADRAGQHPHVGGGPPQPTARLHVDVEREADRRQDTDDRHHDEEIDQREAALAGQLTDT